MEIKEIKLEKLENDVVKFKVEGKACYQIYDPKVWYGKIGKDERNEEKKKIIQQEIEELQKLEEELGYELNYSFTVDKKHRVWVMRDFVARKDLEFKELENYEKEHLQVH